MSYNNINDTDAAYELVAEFDPNAAACAIVKHANPCGVAERADLVEAYRKALACDPRRAFGGIVAVNRTLDGDTARRNHRNLHRSHRRARRRPKTPRASPPKKNLRLLLRAACPIPVRAA